MTRGFTLLAGERAILYHTHRARQVRACVRACLNGVYFPCLERDRTCIRRLSLARKHDTNGFFLEKKKQPQLVQPVFSRGFFLFLFFKYNVLTDRFTDSTKNYENPQCSYRGKMKKQQQRKCVWERLARAIHPCFIYTAEKRGYQWGRSPKPSISLSHIRHALSLLLLSYSLQPTWLSYRTSRIEQPFPGGKTAGQSLFKCRKR